MDMRRITQCVTAAVLTVLGGAYVQAQTEAAVPEMTDTERKEVLSNYETWSLQREQLLASVDEAIVNEDLEKLFDLLTMFTKFTRYTPASLKLIEINNEITVMQSWVMKNDKELQRLEAIHRLMGTQSARGQELVRESAKIKTLIEAKKAEKVGHIQRELPGLVARYENFVMVVKAAADPDVQQGFDDVPRK